MAPNYSQENHHLSVTKVLTEALLFCTERRSSIFNSLKYPGVAILLLSIISTGDYGALDFLFVILNFYFYYIFVVKCHRLFLLGETRDSFKESIYWNKRNTIFVFTSLTLALGIGILMMPIILMTTVVDLFHTTG